MLLFIFSSTRLTLPALILLDPQLEQLNKDLGTQVQFLLKKNLPAQQAGAGGGGSGDVITDHLVTFENVEQLQQRNMQLLKVTRKLKDDWER